MPVENDWQGILYGLGNAFCLALTGFLAKATSGYNPFTLMMCSGACSLFLLSPLNERRSCVDQIRMIKRAQVMSFVASISCMPCAAFFIFIALNFIEYADAITIMQSSIVFSSLLAFLVLKEPLKPVDILCITLSFSGVFLISRPLFIFQHLGVSKSSLYPQRHLGVILSALAATCIAGFAIGRRNILHVDSLLLSTLQGGVTFLMGLLSAAIGWYLLDNPILPDCTIEDRVLMSLAGFSHALCFLFNIQVFKHLSVVHSSTLKTSVSVFSYALQCILVRDSPSYLSVVGCCFIIGSVLCKSYLATHFNKLNGLLCFPS